MTREVAIGSPLLPSQLRKVEIDPDGSTKFHVDTEDHDKALLRSVADAIRTNPEVIDRLIAYAEVHNRYDENQRTDGPPQERAVLEDEAADLLHEIDRDMEWATVGEGQVVRVNPGDTETLASALVYAVAQHIEATEDRATVRDLRKSTVTAAAPATGRTA